MFVNNTVINLLQNKNSSGEDGTGKTNLGTTSIGIFYYCELDETDQICLRDNTTQVNNRIVWTTCTKTKNPRLRKTIQKNE